MTIAIEARGLEKTFPKKRTVRELVTRPFDRSERIRALRGVDLSIREGEIFGLLGPNGAGKTTLLKILSCLVLPDAGSASVSGYDVHREHAVKSRIGLVNTDERSFYWRLNAYENLEFFAVLYGVPKRRRSSRIDELLDRVGLREDARRPFSGYSSGMKQRMAIARALLHDPPILLMDEPSRSLDPSSQLALRRFIAEELSERDHKTIVLATHNLREAEALCHRIAFVAGGRIVRVGTVAEIRSLGFGGSRYRVTVDRWPHGISGPFENVEIDPADDVRRVTFSLGDGVALGEALRPILAAGVSLSACERIELDLEQAFARIVDQSETPEGPA